MEMEGERSIACAAVERQEVSNSTRLLLRIRETTEQLPPMRIRARGDWFPVFLTFCSPGGCLETLSGDGLA